MFKQLEDSQLMTSSATATLVTLVLCLLFAGCGQEMQDQRRVESQEATDVFANGTASRMIPEHTIISSPSARETVSLGQTQPHRKWLDEANANDDGGYLSGKVDGKLINSIPPSVLEKMTYAELIQRGHERFNISCSVCHDQTGSGNGMVARRGLKFPPSYHTDRLRALPLGYLFNVATNGRGQMPAYGDYLSTDDRWAIVAYVRTLQFSQFADAKGLEKSDLKQLQEKTK